MSFVDVGCGSGYLLKGLRMLYYLALMDGYDIPPQVKKFWQLIPEFHSGDIRFFLEDSLHSPLITLMSWS